MAKLFTLFLVLIAIQFSLILFIDPDENNNYSSLLEPNDLWNYLINPEQWMDSPWIQGIITVIVILGGAGILIGSTFGFKTDFLAFATLMTGLISIGSVFANLASFVRSEIAARILGEDCVNQTTFAICGTANLFTAILIGPLALYYVWTVIEWWRGKDI